jgi:hypothetical protein
MAGDVAEARWRADEARAAACDIEDQAVFDATIQLAIDLEMEVVPALVELEVAVPHLRPAER